MILEIPQIPNAIVTSVTFTELNSIKKITVDTHADQIDTGDIYFAENAEIIVNKIVAWNPNPGTIPYD